MVHKYSFIPVFSCLLGGLAWWSVHVQPEIPPNGTVEYATDANIKNQVVNRRDLIEALDRLVVYEHYYHSVYGRFAKLINRTGFNLPRHLTEIYDVRIVEAGDDHLLVSAFSEVNGKTLDMVSIDQDYGIHANFELPPPRSEYLKEQAIKHLRQIRGSPGGQLSSEEGIYRDYFKYSVETDSKDEKVAVALGVQAPVQGVRLELDEKGLLPTDTPEAMMLSDLMKDAAEAFVTPQTGQQPEVNAGHLQEEAYLAQKIFLGEMGRYAKSWSELSRIAHFRFEGKDLNGPVDGAPPKAQPSSRVSQSPIARSLRRSLPIAKIRPWKLRQLSPMIE